MDVFRGGDGGIEHCISGRGGAWFSSGLAFIEVSEVFLFDYFDVTDNFPFSYLESCGSLTIF